VNGPEHYRRAEELLADITHDDGSVDFGDGGEAFVAAAQVHATLALVAATAMAQMPTHPGEPTGMHPTEFEAWREVAGAEKGDNE